MRINLCFALLLAGLVVGACADNPAPTAASSPVNTPGVLGTVPAVGLSDQTDAHCGGIQTHIRFGDPGYVNGQSVGLFVKLDKMPAGAKFLRITWDLLNRGDLYTDVPMIDDAYFEQTITNTYANANPGDSFKVRVDIVIQGYAVNCGRVRDVQLSTGSSIGRGGFGECGGDGQCTVFVTSDEYKSSLGGLAGADLICQSRATAAGFSGRFKAWLSDTSGSPSTRFTRNTVAYVRADDVPVAYDWEDLTDGLLSTTMSVDESGNTVPDGLVWTATRGDGAYAGAGQGCNNWSSGGGSTGHYGKTSTTGAAWSAAASNATCVAAYRLYCVEQ